MTSPRSPLFDPERMRVYPRLAVIVYVLAGFAMIASATSMIDVFGKPLGYDFITFWAASHLTLAGDPVGAFNLSHILAAEQLAVPANTEVFLWHYPPVYQMFVAPLALMPYGLSWFVFVGLGVGLYLPTMRPLFDSKLASGRDALFLALAFPGAFICIFHGQNSLYSAAILVGGLLLLERGRPWLAGFVLGVLVYKPQLGVLLPLAFLASGQWRVFLATGASAFALLLLSYLVFGPDLWQAFFDNTPIVREVMEQGMLPWAKMPSAFVFLREFGVPQSLAYAAQALTALVVAACTALVWRRKGASRLSWAVLIVATLLVSPYAFDYGFAILAPALAIIGSDMAEKGTSRREKIWLIMLFAMPLAVAPFAQATHFQIGFLLLVSALALAVRRVLPDFSLTFAKLSTPAGL
ncbi:MAG: glycosyltransferase family 87 protein [Parvibaculum sp.]